jgi:hypothetical protein
MSMGDPSESVDQWARLGRLLMERRARLDPSYAVRKTFVEAVGLNAGLIRDIETRQRDTFTPSSLAAVEQAYRWAPGSVQRVLAGGDPVELRAPETSRAVLAPDSATALQEAVDRLEHAYAAARQNLIDQAGQGGLSGAPEQARDVNGRYILLDALTTIVQARTALINHETAQRREP